MKCPRCLNEIPDNETICTFCSEKINTDMEINDYVEDGFIQLQTKSDDNLDKNKHTDINNRYIKTPQVNIFVISFVFLLVVAVATIFGFKALQHFTKDTPADEVYPVYQPTLHTEPVQAETKNTVKNISIKNIYGSWKFKGIKEQNNYAIQYFSFAKDGAAQYDYGSCTVLGYFEDYSDKKDNRVYIELDGQLNGVFKFNVKGNEKDGYELILKNLQSGYNLKFESTTAKTYKLNTIKDYKIDKNIIGEWSNKDNTKSYTFTKDGRFSRCMGNQIRRGVWSQINEEMLTLRYMDSHIRTTNIQYSFFDDTLIINNVIYKKVK